MRCDVRGCPNKGSLDTRVWLGAYRKKKDGSDGKDYVTRILCKECYRRTQFGVNFPKSSYYQDLSKLEIRRPNEEQIIEFKPKDYKDIEDSLEKLYGDGLEV